MVLQHTALRAAEDCTRGGAVLEETEEICEADKKQIHMVLKHFDKKEKKNLVLGDSIKVGFGFDKLQFFTGTITKISGHKITLFQPKPGIERIFSYKNPQIQNLFIMAVPKRRSKSRRILWRKKSLKKNRQKRQVAMVKLVNTQA